MKGSQIQPQICGYLEPKHQENRRISLTSPIFTRRKSKREWIVLDEDALKLVAFQDEESANRPKKEPLYSISLVNAVFGIELDNPLTFYIVSGRKYTYQAETHNGMLTWLSCLQACRDERNVAIRSDSGSEVAENVAYSTLPRYQRHISEHHLLRNLPKTYSFTSVKSGILKIPNTNTETNVNRLSIRDDGANSVFEHSPGPTSPFSEDTGFFIGEKASVAGSSMPAPNVTNRNNSDDSNFSAFEEPHPNLRLELQQSLEMVEKLQKQNQHLEEEVRDLRMDYSSLLQTCCMYKLDGSMETGQPANFIITNRHKDRISRILEAARKEDPRLPPTSLLSSQSGHTDSYGFQEIFTNVDMTILYVTSRLLDVYTLTSPAEELKIMKWKDFLHMDFATIPRYKLKELCRQGIPGELREQVWTKLIELGVGKIQQEVGPRYYQTLVARVNDSQIDSSHRRQIMLDVLRTFPNHIAFNRPEGFGVQQMQEVLQAFTLHNRAVGYCQGMNFIAGNATLFLDKETTFWLLVLFVEHHFPPNYFNAGLIAAQADQNVLRELLGRYCPELSASLQTLEVDISTITFNWFIAVFVNSVPI
uniref:Rab-GAP TBC domain-containing protein n=1 Tax=Mesocestoides corti TaxID=53468 RepID=A0A5K3FI10_MESCO